MGLFRGAQEFGTFIKRSKFFALVVGGTIEILPGVHWIPRINGNCYLLVDHELTLIDTGLPHHAKKILDYVTDVLHRKPSDVTTILLTHYHIDHIANAEELRRLTGAKIAAHQDDVDYIEGKQPMPRPKNLLFSLATSVMHIRPFPVDIHLQDAAVVAGCTVIHLPGHTPGSIGLLAPRQSVLFCGDTLRSPKGNLEAPSQQFSFDYEKAMQSIQRIKTLEFDVLLSGHGEPVRPQASAKVRSAFPS